MLLLPSVAAPGLRCVFLMRLIRGADSLWRRALIPFVGCFSWQPLFIQSGPPHSGKGIKTAESQPGAEGTEKQVLALTGIYHLFWWMNNIRAHIRPLKQTIFASHFFEYLLFEGQNENGEVRTSHEQEQVQFSGVQEKWQAPSVFQGNTKSVGGIFYGLWKNSRNTFTRESPFMRVLWQLVRSWWTKL